MKMTASIIHLGLLALVHFGITMASAPEPLVALAGGSAAYEGRAMMYDVKNKKWGSICDVAFAVTGWPSVLCKQLGYEKATIAVLAKNKKLEGSGHIAFQSPMCNPTNAKNMSQCGQDKKPACGHNKDVYVKCKVSATPKVTVALKGGKSAYEGLATMFDAKNKRWGSICDIAFVKTGWPSVLCKQLGYENAELAVYAKTKNVKVSGPIAFQSPMCNPTNAKSMSACGKDKNPACDHGKDVYVRCKPAPIPKVLVALRDGKSNVEGRAMLYDTKRRLWGSVCDVAFVKTGWPSVLCKQLGHQFAELAVYAKTKSATGTGPITYQSPKCSPSNAKSMAECGSDKVPACDHSKDVYVKCKQTPQVQTTKAPTTRPPVPTTRKPSTRAPTTETPTTRTPTTETPTTRTPTTETPTTRTPTTETPTTRAPTTTTETTTGNAVTACDEVQGTCMEVAQCPKDYKSSHSQGYKANCGEGSKCCIPKSNL